MAESHTATSARDPSDDSSRLTLVSTLEHGLSERLAGRVDGHLAAFAEYMREGLLAASTAVGLEVMAEMMELEVAELVGPKGRHDADRATTRHGNEHGSVTLGGRRVPVRRPRVRTIASDDQSAREVPLASYTTFASTDLLAEQVVARMLAGISTRRYPAALEPVGSEVEQTASSTSKSAVTYRTSTTSGTSSRVTPSCAHDVLDNRKARCRDVATRCLQSWIRAESRVFSADHRCGRVGGVGLESPSVPGGQRFAQRSGADDADAIRADGICPFDPLRVPQSKRPGVGLHDEVFIEPGVMLADFGVVAVDQQPQTPGVCGLVGKLEPDDDTVVGEPLTRQVCGGPRPQHQRRVGVLVAQLEPLLAPVTQRPQHPAQVAASVGELISDAAT